MVEEGLHRADAELAAGIALELKVTEAPALIIDAAMAPGTDHQADHVILLVLRFQRLVDRWGAIAVLLVPLAHDQHGRHGQRALGQQLVDRLFLPIGIIGRMFEQLAHRGKCVEAIGASEVAGRSGVQHRRIFVAIAHRDGAAALLGGLRQAVAEAEIAEGAIMEPVVAHPSVDHRALRHGGFQRRVRIDQRH